MTLRQFIEELNQVPEEHKDKAVLSISGNTINQGIQHIYMYPESRLTWDCNFKLIALRLASNEDKKYKVEYRMRGDRGNVLYAGGIMVDAQSEEDAIEKAWQHIRIRELYPNDPKESWQFMAFRC